MHLHGLRSNYHFIQKPGAQRNEDDFDRNEDGDDKDEEGYDYYEGAMTTMMMMMMMMLMIKSSREKGEDGWLVGSFRPTADSSNFSRFNCFYHDYNEGSILSW